MTLTQRIIVGAFVFVMAVGAVADANVRVPTTTGGPFYARIERTPDGQPFVFHTDEWAVIPFYRSPECVPPDFNLLDFFDFANIPAIFACELTIVGFEIYPNDAPPGAAPIQAMSFGLDAMPVWFVQWSELEAAVADDVLTMAELEGLTTLVKGTATFFKETLHPGAFKLQMVGGGILEDGRSFSFEGEETHYDIKHIRIAIE